MRVFSGALLLLHAFSVSVDAEVHICSEATASADCYVSFAVMAPIKDLDPAARFAQSVTLETSSKGRPWARVFWRLTATNRIATDNDTDEYLPVTVQQELLANFRTDIPKIVCGPETRWNSEGQFVRSGGVVSYSLYLTSKEKTTVTITSCEAL